MGPYQFGCLRVLQMLYVPNIKNNNYVSQFQAIQQKNQI